MRLVLLSGGSGKRLWPLSNDSRSKQFLKILENSNGDYVSMVQRVYKQLETVNLNQKAIIATSKSQVEMIHSQLGDGVPVVIEPERRDTFAAIALSATYLYSVEKIDKNEVVVVLPVDPYVEDRFFEKVTMLEEVVITTGCDLALMGVTPTYPSSKYGYIVPNDKVDNKIIKVKSFSEKPSEEMANELINQGALWNCGVFAFKLDYILTIIKDLGLPQNYTELQQYYSLLPKNSFDYEVVEKASEIVAISYNGYWKDLGTWNTLTEEMGSNIIGKGIISKDSSNTHLVNELDIPIAILGASELLVAASPDGILVTEKSASPRLKELVTEFTHRPMFEERRWGSYMILDHTSYDDSEVITKKIKICAGKNLSYQFHEKRIETWNVLKGTGEVILDGLLKDIGAGDIITIPSGMKHAIKAITNLEIIEIQSGKEIIREDIYRIEGDWGLIVSSQLKNNNNLYN